MILHQEFKDDVLDRIRTADDSFFAQYGTTREAVLADDAFIDSVWCGYQKSVEEYDADGDSAFTDAVNDAFFERGVSKKAAEPSPDPLMDANADGPVELTEEEREKAVGVLNKFIDQLILLRYCAANGQLTKSTVKTHLSLTRHGFNDLSELLDSGETISKELASTTAKLREANSRIRELQSQMGSGVTGEALAAGLRRYENMFRAWYEHIGFKYASTRFTAYDIIAEFTEELYKPDTVARYLSDKETYSALNVPYEIDDLFVNEDTYHNVLLATEKNRSRLAALFRKYFPNCRLNKTEAHLDRNIWTLRCQVCVPYADIEKMYHKFSKKENKK